MLENIQTFIVKYLNEIISLLDINEEYLKGLAISWGK
jgi:hypothetical protein